MERARGGEGGQDARSRGLEMGQGACGGGGLERLVQEQAVSRASGIEEGT